MQYKLKLNQTKRPLFAMQLLKPLKSHRGSVENLDIENNKSLGQTNRLQSYRNKMRSISQNDNLQASQDSLRQISHEKSMSTELYKRLRMLNPAKQPAVQQIEMSKLTCTTRTQQGWMQHKRKINQDRYLVVPNIGGTNRYFFGVFDGHGSNGHLVAQYIKDNFPLVLNSKKDQLELIPFQGMQEVYKEVSLRLKQSSKIEISESGSTVTGIYIQNGKLYCGNVGDSRAVMFYCNEDGIPQFKQLSRDHKPDDKDEAIRIYNSGGVVQQQKDNFGNYVGPLRVWNKQLRSPGLSLTRSFGDIIGKYIGVTDIPEIKIFKLPIKYRILIGSDGLFENLGNQQIMNLVMEQDDLEKAADMLMQRACHYQTRHYSDDVTFILLTN